MASRPEPDNEPDELYFVENTHKKKTFVRNELTVDNGEVEGPVRLNKRELFNWEVLQHADLIHEDEVRDMKKSQLQEFADRVGAEYSPEATKKEIYKALGLKVSDSDG